MLDVSIHIIYVMLTLIQDVTPENFLKILQGEDMSGTGSGKVIKRY